MTRHDEDRWTPPTTASTNLHLSDREVARVDDLPGTDMLRLGDRDVEVTVFARCAGSARKLAEAATGSARRSSRP
jgi:hypothetical protein